MANIKGHLLNVVHMLEFYFINCIEAPDGSMKMILECNELNGNIVGESICHYFLMLSSPTDRNDSRKTSSLINVFPCHWPFRSMTLI